MRKLLLLAVPAALLVACGSSNNNKKPVDRTFTPKATRAIPANSGPDPCVVTGRHPMAFTANAVALELTTAGANAAAAGTLACADITNSHCQYHPGSQTLALMFARVMLGPPYTVLPLRPGRYDLDSNPTHGDVDFADFTTTVAFAQLTVAGADPTCAPMTALVATSGTLTVDSLADPITGSVSMTFQDESTFSGTFSAPFCPDAITSTEVCNRSAAGSFCTGAQCVTPP